MRSGATKKRGGAPLALRAALDASQLPTAPVAVVSSGAQSDPATASIHGVTAAANPSQSKKQRLMSPAASRDAFEESLSDSGDSSSVDSDVTSASSDDESAASDGEADPLAARPLTLELPPLPEAWSRHGLTPKEEIQARKLAARWSNATDAYHVLMSLRSSKHKRHRFLKKLVSGFVTTQYCWLASINVLTS